MKSKRQQELAHALLDTHHRRNQEEQQKDEGEEEEKEAEEKSTANAAIVVADDDSSQHADVVEVCQGPDCFGCGGGAAILELEDLGAAFSCIANNNNNQSTSPTKFRVVPGGCRNFCAMGPNVHYHYQGSDHQHHFTKVQSVQKCREIVDHVKQRQSKRSGAAASTTSNDDNNGSKQRGATAGGGIGIMMQRAEKKRWTFLRQVARARAAFNKASSSSSSYRSGLASMTDLAKELDNILAAERAAARDNRNALERVEKRKAFYESILNDLSKPQPKQTRSSSGSEDEDESDDDSSISSSDKSN